MASIVSTRTRPSSVAARVRRSSARSGVSEPRGSVAGATAGDSTAGTRSVAAAAGFAEAVGAGDTPPREQPPTTAMPINAHHHA